MSTQLARFFSFLFHPVFIPIYSFFVIVSTFPFQYLYIPKKVWNISVIILLMMTCVFPSIMTLILNKLKIVDDLDISVRKQRILPYMIFLFFYLMSFMMFKPKEVSSIIFLEDGLIATILLGATISIGIAFFLNNFLKVSIHSCANANLFAFCCLLAKSSNKNMFSIILFTFLIMGFVGASRIKLEAHTKNEVYVGIITGIIGQTLAFLFYFNA